MCMEDHCHYGDPAPPARRLRRREVLELAGIGALIAACGGGTVTASPSPTGARLIEGFTWYKQSAFRWRGERTVYIDPWGLSGDLSEADLVLVTHIHQDHFSPDDVKKVTGAKTTLVAPKDVAAILTGNVRAVAPGDRVEVAGIKVEAVPAYNIVESRLQAHPRTNGWVGYVIELPGRTIYHAGDTDDVAELRALKADVAFVPIGGRFTMDVKEAAGLVKAMRPKLAVPMHYGFFPGAGKGSDGEAFSAEASPVEVHVLTPLTPFVTP